MQIRPVLIHVVFAALVGAAISAFTPARWFAASLWVSAAMLLNGAAATVEDSQPGALDNPDGSIPRPGLGLLAAKLVAVAIALTCLGFWVQFAWHASA